MMTTKATTRIGTSSSSSSSSSMTTTRERMLGGVLPRRRTKRRHSTASRGKVAGSFIVRAAEEEDGEEEDKATYKETFDSSTGQMVKTLTQSIEQIDVNGQTWTQRRGSPSGKNKENKERCQLSWSQLNFFRQLPASGKRRGRILIKLMNQL